ncbi:MAG: hypothetical protein WBL50_11105 [Candidatus Acidiferrum sp.]
MTFERFVRPSNVFLCFFGVVLFALAVTARQRATPVYDPATVVTVSGTVETVEQHQCSLGWGGYPVRTSWLGTHVMLRTDYGVLDAHLGPSLFLKQHDFILLKGDELEVTGSKFAGDLPVILIAKELKKGRRLLELRDRSGQPLWQD